MAGNYARLLLLIFGVLSICVISRHACCNTEPCYCHPDGVAVTLSPAAVILSGVEG